LAFINDNDFAFVYDTKAKVIVPTGVPTKFLYVTLAQKLPTTPDAEVAAMAKSAAQSKATKLKVTKPQVSKSQIVKAPANR
jgi:hypothetical protein